MSKKVVQNDLFLSLSRMEKITCLYNKAVTTGRPVAIWSLPGSDEFKVIIDFSESINSGKIELEKSLPGFIYSPFKSESGSESYFLRADLIYSSKTDAITISPMLTGVPASKADQFLQSLEKTTPTADTQPLSFQKSSDYKELVKTGIDLIKSGQYDKLVLSRNRKIELPDGFDPIQTLQRLRKAYQNAFCYLLSTKRFGSWMAATPETLISLTDETFETVALAGTSVLGEGQSLSTVSWTQKEIEEQAMVSRYVINCFKKIRLREFEETGPKTVKAGNLAHLKTWFRVKYKNINFHELGTVMLELLHPTSAVCGMPLEGARRFIREQEGFDRSLFAGFLGPVNVDNATNIYVNLRTMRFNEREAVLYAGAGITSDSDPDKEYMETEMKMKTLLNIIQS